MSLQTPLGKTRRANGTKAAGIDLGATTADILPPIMGPVNVWRIGCHLTSEAKTTGTKWVVTLYACDGTTETTLGTWTGPDVLAVGADTYKEWPTTLSVPLGSYLRADVTTAGNTGQGIVWVEYTDEPLTLAWLSGLTAST